MHSTISIHCYWIRRGTLYDVPTTPRTQLNVHGRPLDHLGRQHDEPLRWLLHFVAATRRDSDAPLQQYMHHRRPNRSPDST